MNTKFIVFVSLFFTYGTAFAMNKIYTVPFDSVGMRQGEKIMVDYHFNRYNQALTCVHGGDPSAMTQVEWEYNGTKERGSLPISLESKNADYAGYMTISYEINPARNNQMIWVACKYKNL